MPSKAGEPTWAHLRGEGNRYEMAHNYDAARKTFVLALESAKKIGATSPEVAETDARLASICLEQHNIRDAEFYTNAAIDVAMALRKAGKENTDMAYSMEDLAAAYTEEASNSEPEFCYKKAIEIREKLFGPDHPNRARSYVNLAIFNLDHKRYSEAVPLFDKIAEINNRPTNTGKSNPSKFIDELAMEKYKKHKLDECDKISRVQIELSKKTKDTRFTSHAYQMIAKVYAVKKKLDVAESYYKKAVQYDEANRPKTFTLVRAFMELARFYCANHRSKEADQEYNHAIELARKVDLSLVERFEKEQADCKNGHARFVL